MLAKLFQFIGGKSPGFAMRFLFNLYPPNLGAGIKVLRVDSDFKYIKVSLKLRFYNQNYVGTQYGGSIYAMTDPYYMYLLINCLGSKYIVWDRGARVEFLKPGKTDLTAEFRLTDELLAEVRERTKTGEKYVFDLPVQIRDVSGEVVAEVMKTLYVRLKRKNRKPQDV